MVNLHQITTSVLTSDDEKEPYLIDGELYVKHRLWFDVGTTENTTVGQADRDAQRLWFDVGTTENTTIVLSE